MTTKGNPMKPLPRNAAQARRLLSGATQFRLPVVPQPPSVESVKAISGSDYGWMRCDDMKQPEYFRPVGPVWAVRSLLPKGVDTVSLKSPFVPGDTIYVQEEWRAYLDDMGFALTVNYREDDTVTDIDPDSVQWEKLSDAIDWQWQTAETMPQWMSRIYLEVLDVRVERVKDISKDDCLSEGMTATEFVKMLRPLASKSEPENPYWVDDVDGVFCRECVRKFPKDSVDGGFFGEEDHPIYCETCGKLLDFTLTDYGVAEELAEFERSGSITTPDDAYVMHRVLSADGHPHLTEKCGDWEYMPELRGRVAKLAYRHAWQSDFQQHPFDSSWCFAFSVKRKGVTNG